MCNECLKSPCDPRCPNAEEPQVFGECDFCKEEIRVGETAYYLYGQMMCEDCFYNIERIEDVGIYDD